MTEAQGKYPVAVHPDIEKEEFEFEKNWRVAETIEDQIGFIRKVFGILAVQMIVTCGAAVGGALMKEDMQKYQRNPALVLLSIGLIIGCALTIMINIPARRTVPYNYMLLFGLTLGEAFAFAGLTSRMDVQAVLCAIGALAMICSALFLAVWNMKDC